MKNVLTVLAVFIAVGAALYAAYWGYYALMWGETKGDWRQHLPITRIAVHGVDREYHLFVPASPPPDSMPLLVLLQGGDAGSWQFPQQNQWEELAEKEGIVIAIPIGKLLPPNEGAWQLNTDARSRQDVDYVEAMIDDVSSSHSIDASEVYAVGYSLGSMFSYELACQMSDRFAAIASFAGTMPVSPKDCDPKRNVPLMHIHGVADPIIAYGQTWDWKNWDSVGTMRDIPALVEFWRKRYGCQGEHRAESDGEVHLIYDSCEQDARVEHHRLEKVGHEWPDSLNGVSTHRVIWSFLSRFSMP